LGGKNLAKSLLISTLEEVIYYIPRNIFTGLNKTSLYDKKQAGDQLKKIRPFFNMLLLA
jgi:hypothetical protein